MADQLECLKAALADRYSIERELGRGGMAVVYLAHDLKLRRDVALKVLRPELAASLGADRFLCEIEIAAKLTHPNILALYDCGEADGQLYYTMPFVEGESLRDRLSREKQLPIDDALQITREVADALGHAHSLGIVHRDIKPENILFTAGHAVVSDFGIARAVTEAGAETLTETGLAVGTPAYMSPEQATGTKEIDARTDIYSLGCVLYETLSGDAPYVASTPQAVIAKKLSEPVPRVSVVRERVPASVEAAIEQALAKTPADRFATARGFADALVEGKEPVDAERAARQGHPVRVAALFGVLSAGVLALVYLLMDRLGLPDWVFLGAVVLLAIGLPIMLVIGQVERRRALARVTGAARSGGEGVLHSWLTWRKAVLGGVFAFATLGVVATAYTIMRLAGIGPVGTLVAAGVLDERESLVLAQFENRTADSMLGPTVTQLFRVGLSQSPILKILEPTEMRDVLDRMELPPEAHLDPQLAIDVAEREGLKAVIAGEIMSVGRGYALSARLLYADGSVLTAQRESAENADGIIAAVDRLSAKLRERVGESLRSIRRNDPLFEVTTPSLEALRLYTQAEYVNDAGDAARAVELLEEAIRIDTAFAMAYRKLGAILGNTLEQRARMRTFLEVATQQGRPLNAAQTRVLQDYLALREPLIQYAAEVRRG